jgi:hypothetical protein
MPLLHRLHIPQQALSKGSLPATSDRPNNRLNCGLRKAFLFGCIFGIQPDQIKVEDEEKTSFIAPYVVFCYQVMPFCLKNAGATYQRMMQNCLGSQIGRNIQAYINDMVITTRN